MTSQTPIDTRDDVDPNIRTFVNALNHGYAQFEDFGALPLPERRAAAEQVRAPWREGGPQMWRTTDLQIDGVPLRIHRPTEAALPGILYIHGGGWTMFSINTHDRLMREYAARANVIVVGIDYSLSPEAKFPTALDEIIATFEWLRSQGADHGIDPARIAIGGDSVGANLSVAASLKLQDEGQPLPAAMLLNYGAFADQPSASYERYDGPNYMLTVDEMALFWGNYARNADDLANPLAAPLLADLVGLPPAHITIAECDILADGNRLMAERLAAAGVAVEAPVYLGATHSFLEAVSISPLADQAIEASSRWLHEQLATS